MKNRCSIAYNFTKTETLQKFFTVNFVEDFRVVIVYNSTG